MSTSYAEHCRERLPSPFNVRAFAIAVYERSGVSNEPRPLHDDFDEAHYLSEIAEAEADLAAAEAMTLAEAQIAAGNHWDQVLVYREQVRVENAHNAAERTRLLAMIDATSPPTPAHAWVWDRMRQEVRSAYPDVRDLCADAHPYTAEEWRAEAVAYKQANVLAARRHLDEARAASLEGAEWLRALREGA